MALFRILRGNEEALQSFDLHDGYAYFCADTGNFYIDVENSRIQLNANAAKKLHLVADDSSVIEIDVAYIQALATRVDDLQPDAVLNPDSTRPVQNATLHNIFQEQDALIRQKAAVQIVIWGDDD